MVAKPSAPISGAADASQGASTSEVMPSLEDDVEPDSEAALDVATVSEVLPLPAAPVELETSDAVVVEVAGLLVLVAPGASVVVFDPDVVALLLVWVLVFKALELDGLVEAAEDDWSELESAGGDEV